MNKKKWQPSVVFTGLMLIIMLTSIGNVYSQPVIINADFYTDNWGPNPLGWEEGHHFIVCAGLSGYYDENDNLPVVTATNNGTSVNLFYDWGNTYVTWFCRMVTQDFPDAGVLTITTGTAVKNTCNLNDIQVISLAENVRYSYDASSNLPVISWNSVEYAHRYFVRFYLNGDELRDCRSSSLRNPSYEIPNDLSNCNIDPNNDYVVRILSTNYDVCDQYDSGYALENRSSTWADFIPPPESNEILIDLDPDTLNRKSKGNFLTCYIDPEGYTVDEDNIRLIVNGTVISAELWPKEWNDFDNDGAMELMVKFDRQEFIDTVDIGQVDITVNVDTQDGNLLFGFDRIRVIGK